jgi:hypothetical protein
MKCVKSSNHYFKQDTSYNRDDVKEYLDDQLRGYSKEEIKKLVEDGELHNEIFNTGYYVAYTNEAEEWLGNRVFDVIRTVKEYEEDNFGEVNTDITDPVKLVNMYVYIVGEELINENPKLRNY